MNIYKWKMQFNHDLNKQAQEIIFLRKRFKPGHPSIHCNDAPVTKGNPKKHLGSFFHKKLNFNHHMKEKLAKAMMEYMLSGN